MSSTPVFSRSDVSWSSLSGSIMTISGTVGESLILANTDSMCTLNYDLETRNDMLQGLCFNS